MQMLPDNCVIQPRSREAPAVGLDIPFLLLQIKDLDFASICILYSFDMYFNLLFFWSEVVEFFFQLHTFDTFCLVFTAFWNLKKNLFCVHSFCFLLVFWNRICAFISHYHNFLVYIHKQKRQCWHYFTNF